VPLAEEDDALRTIVRAAFGTRRKTLRNGLVREVGARADELLAAAGIDGRRRGETLGIEELAALAAALRA
jgi:16S rRNA (adenine1518-N6/adenine1519-N6)-dimethyltransferase